MKKTILIFCAAFVAACSGEQKISLNCVMEHSNNEVEVLITFPSEWNAKKECLITYSYNGKMANTRKGNLTKTERVYLCKLPESVEFHKRDYQINRLTGNLRIEGDNGITQTGSCSQVETKF